MSGRITGKRYAKALLELAEEKKQIDQVEQELTELVEILDEQAALVQVFQDPKLPRKDKEAIMGEICAKVGVSQLVNNFSRLLISKNRLDIIADILAVYQSMASEKLGKATAEVVVAKELSSEQVATLQKQLADYTGKDISLNVQVDADILGGAITKIDSLVLDGSIRNRLNLIRETIIRG